MLTVSGKKIHPIGIGTWRIGGQTYQPGGNDDAVEAEAIRYCLSLGQNHIDTAEMYGGGHSEEVVGQAIRGLRREDILIADKLWRHSLEPGKVRPAVEAMLKRLGTDYIDVLYIHAAWQDAPWRAAIAEINAVIDAGLVRAFGVSNFSLEEINEAIRLSSHSVAMTQEHYNVLDKQYVDERYRTFCRENEVAIVAYQPIKRGEVGSDETIRKIAGKYGATPGQVALAWLIAKETLPIPKAIRREHIDENFQAADLSLNPEDIKILDGI